MYSTIPQILNKLKKFAVSEMRLQFIFASLKLLTILYFRMSKTNGYSDHQQFCKSLLKIALRPLNLRYLPAVIVSVL